MFFSLNFIFLLVKLLKVVRNIFYQIFIVDKNTNKVSPIFFSLVNKLTETYGYVFEYLLIERLKLYLYYASFWTYPDFKIAIQNSVKIEFLEMDIRLCRFLTP